MTPTPEADGPGWTPPPGAPPPPADDSPYRSPDAARRLVATVKALFSLYTELFREEAEQAFRRLLLMAALLGASAAFGAASLLTVAFILILGVQRLTGWPLLESAATGLGLFVTIILCLLGLFALLLQRPWLARSRVLVARTIAALRPEAPTTDAPST